MCLVAADVNAAPDGACLVLAPHVYGNADHALERFPGRAAAEFP